MSNILQQRLNMIGPWLKKRLGARAVKIGLDLNLGCPNNQQGLRCIYCSPLAAGQGQGMKPLLSQLEHGSQRIQPNKVMLAYFQAFSSTNAPADFLAPLFYQAATFPGIKGIIISTRPDCLQPAHWKLLADLKQQSHLCWLELGLQSSHDHTLRLIARGHDAATFARALKQANHLNIPVVAHAILGLPGETMEHTRQTARWLADQGIWGVKLHSLMVLKGTRLAQMWQAGSFIPWSMQEWVAACADFISWLPPHITIHRLSADPGHDICLAPDWVNHKAAALNALGNYLRENNIYQGSGLLKPQV